MTQIAAIDTTQDLDDALPSEENSLNEAELAAIKRKSVSGVISFMLRTGFLQGIGLVAQAILTGYFVSEDFAIFGFIIQIISLLTFFSDIGLASALIQKKAEPTTTDYRSAFTVQFLLSVLIVLISLGLIASGLITSKTGPAGAWILLALSVSFPLATLKLVPSIILERQLNFNRKVIPDIFEQVVFQSVLIFLVLSNFGVIAYAYALFLRSIVGVAVMTYLQRWPFGFSLNKTALKALLGYGSKFQLFDLLARVKDNLFSLVMGWWLLPFNQFGDVTWAKQWSMYPYSLTVQNVMAITFPTFSRLQGNQHALKRAIEKSLFFISLGILPILVGMAVFFYPLTQVIAKYQKWEHVHLTFVLFTLSIAWGAISTPLNDTLKAIGKINTSLKLMVMWTVLTWVVTPLCIWRFGFDGVAIAAFLISFTSLLPIYYVKQVIPIKVWPQIWRQLLAASLMAVVGVGGVSLWSSSLPWMLVGMVVVAATYLLSLAAVGYRHIMKELMSLRQKKTV